MNATHLAGKHAQSLVALLVAAVGFGGIVGGLMYGPLTDKGLVGPGFMPLVSGALTLIAGLCVFISSCLVNRHDHPRPGDALLQPERDNPATVPDDRPDNEAMPEEPVHPVVARRHAVRWTFGVIGVAIASVPLLGLLLSLTLMTGALVGVVERRPWWVMLACMLGAFLIGHVVFRTLLGIPLPRGYLGLL